MQGSCRLLERVVAQGEVAAELREKETGGTSARMQSAFFCPAHLGIPGATRDLAKSSCLSKYKLKYVQAETMPINIINSQNKSFAP